MHLNGVSNQHLFKTLHYENHLRALLSQPQLKVCPLQIAEAKRIAGAGMGPNKQPNFTYTSPLFHWNITQYTSVIISE